MCSRSGLLQTVYAVRELDPAAGKELLKLAVQLWNTENLKYLQRSGLDVFSGGGRGACMGCVCVGGVAGIRLLKITLKVVKHQVQSQLDEVLDKSLGGPQEKSHPPPTQTKTESSTPPIPN